MDSRPTHTDRGYDDELEQVRAHLLEMGVKLEGMIANSLRAVLARDDVLARRTIRLDDEIDRLEVETDELCLSILARRQPVASDLRLIATALKMVTDLERVGDMAVDICKRSLELSRELSPPRDDLTAMTELTSGMLHDALFAFVKRDVELARALILRDQEVDARYAHVVDELLSAMIRDPSLIRDATRLQSIAKYLERVGDHATNLAEMVVFMVEAEDIRHATREHAPHLA
jgi:phosphate transport system protein